MSPKKPVHLKGNGTRSPDSGAIELPNIAPLPSPVRLPGTGGAPRPSIAALASGTSASITVQRTQPTHVDVTDLSTSASASKLSPHSPLASYSITPPEGLPPPGIDGLRVDGGNHHFADLGQGNVTRVLYDEAVGAYRALGQNETSPSGPALYRPEGETLWRENPFATKLRLYQMNKEHRANFDRQSRALLSQAVHARDAALSPAFGAQKAHLKADAQSFYDTFTAKPRMPIPPLTGVTAFHTLVETLLEQTPGLVLGERYCGTGSKKLLMENMPALAANGLTTLYLDRFRTDIDQAGLDRFASTGVVDRALHSRLQELDVNTDTFPSTSYTYLNLIIAARNSGIRIRALDCAARYQMDPYVMSVFSQHDQARLFKYHATQVINADRLSYPENKWVALVGITQRHEHNNPFSLAQLQGVTGLHIEDVPGGPTLRIPQQTLSDSQVKLEAGVQGVASYELPSRYRGILEPDIRKANLDHDHDPNDLFQRIIGPKGISFHRAQTEHSQRRRDLKDASQRFFKRRPERLPKARIPALEADSPALAIIEAIYGQSTGLVMGSAYNAIGARAFLIDNMPDLAAQQVKTLYLENLLTDYDQPLLDLFFSSAVMPEKLKANLQRQDELQQVDPQSAHALENLVDLARRHGIKVQALDTSTSFDDELRRYNPNRAMVFKYMACKIIDADQVQRGAHNWLALVESEHVNTVRSVLGLAELQGAIGLRVTDVGGQPALRVAPDEGELISRLLPTRRPAGNASIPPYSHQHLKSDLKLEFNIQAQPIPRSLVSPTVLLHAPNEFLIDRTGEGFTLYLTRESRSIIDAYPVLMSDSQFSITAPHLTTVNQVQFQSLDDLAWALGSVGKTQVHGATVLPAPAVPRLMDLNPQLTRPGMFLIESRAEGIQLYHRSRNRSVKRTLVNHDEVTGKLYIQRPEWALSQANLFDSLDDLARHLESTGMTHYVVARPQ